MAQGIAFVCPISVPGKGVRMMTMQFSFVFIAICGALYHILLRRRVDFLTASYFGLLLYFLPAFGGYVLDPYNIALDAYVPIIDQTYLVFIGALAGNIVFSLIYRPSASAKAAPLTTDPRFDILLSIATIISFLLAFNEAGSALLDPDKNIVLLNQGRFWFLFSALAQICTFSGVIGRRILPLICGISALTFSTFVGDRSLLAVTGVALVLYYFSTTGMRNIFSLKIVVPGLFLVFFIFVYKYLYIDIKYGNYALAFDKLFSADMYRNAFSHSEPFVTQSILNTVIMMDFRVSMESILSAFIAIFPFLSEILKLPPNLIGFNFQDILFPHLDYGLASNIYANFYGIFGYIGIVIWIIMQNTIMIFFSRASLKWQGYKRIPLMLCGSLMSFYVVRSDIVYNITSLNRIIYTFLAMYLVFMAVAYFGKSGRQSLNDAAANSAHYNRP